MGGMPPFEYSKKSWMMAEPSGCLRSHKSIIKIVKMIHKGKCHSSIPRCRMCEGSVQKIHFRNPSTSICRISSIQQPAFYLVLFGNFSRTFHLPVHNDGRGPQHTTGSDLHHIGDLFHVCSHAGLLKDVYHQFFRFFTFCASGTQNLDFHFDTSLYVEHNCTFQTLTVNDEIRN